MAQNINLISIHAHIGLYVDTEVDILSEMADILWQLSRRRVQQSGEVTVGGIDPLIQNVCTVHHLRNAVHT